MNAFIKKVKAKDEMDVMNAMNEMDAYITVEAAIIIPLCLIITMLVLTMTFYLHDRIMIRNILYSGASQLEIYDEDEYEYASENFLQQLSDYANNKTLFAKNISVAMKENDGKNYLSIGYEFGTAVNYFMDGNVTMTTLINRMNPPKFVRICNAVREAFD